MDIRSEGISRIDRSDRHEVSRLFQHTLQAHVHLDWRGLESWLTHPDLRAWAHRADGHLSALVGATLHGNALDPAYRMAWLRFIANPLPSGIAPVLLPLYEALRHDLVESGVRAVAILSVDPWVDELAKRWGYHLGTSVVTLQRCGGPLPALPAGSPPIRPARESDLDAIAAVDARAFSPLWHYDRAVLEYAMLQAATFTVVEVEGAIVGYQLSSAGLTQGHLARLAVDPAHQGRGLGRLLTADMITALRRRGLEVITVNTQSDNLASQKLYHALGFHLYGRKYPVWVTEL